MKCDILIRGGEVVDPAQNLRAVRDIAVSGGKIAAVEASLPDYEAPDVRRHGVTYFNYVGKPLTYILGTDPKPDDADSTLRIAFGNEGAEHDLERFAERFGCLVTDSYGSTEGGIAIENPARPVSG